MDRDPNVVLADDIARCVPSQPCTLAPHCARARALIPKLYARLGDFTVTRSQTPPFGCAEYRAIVLRSRKP